LTHSLWRKVNGEGDALESPNDDALSLVLDRKNHPHVEVQFGDVIGRAVWDSGAGMTIVDLDFARRHPAYFREVGRSCGTDATGASVETPVFTLTGADIGGRPFKPHLVAGVNLSRINDTVDMPMDLILGYSTLTQANWWFDFPGRRWKITKLFDGS